MRRVLIIAAWLLLFGELWSGASESAWRRMELPPESARLVRLAETTRDPRAAARLHAEAIRLCPSNGPALYGVAYLMLAQDRPADALKIFRRLNALFPGEADIAAGLAAAIVRLPGLRRPLAREGLACAERAVAQQPEFPEAWHLLSLLRHFDGDYSGAAEAARRAIQCDAQNPSDPETTARYQQQEIACTDAVLAFSPLD